MVSERSCIVTHAVESRYLYAAVKEIEIRRTLTEIARIDQQQVLIQRALLTYQTHTARIPRAVISLGLYLRMRIIRVQNRQMILGRASHRQHCYQAIKEYVSHSMYTLYT